MEDTAAHSLTTLSEEELAQAANRYKILLPFFENNVTLARISREGGPPVGTLRDWVNRYRKYGLTGLVRKSRSDKGFHRMSSTLLQAIEGLALKRPRLSVASIQRQAAVIAKRLAEPVPSYQTVRTVIRRLDPALLTLRWEV